jgi:beta-glucanase (GH16 family)
MKRLFGKLALLALLVNNATSLAAAPDRVAAKSGWKLTWSDEFNRPGANLPDPSKWTLETGGNGWGNNELEYYTARLDNAKEQDGLLTVRAAKEDYLGANGKRRAYTSARLKTKDKFSQRYGRFEARIELPYGKGIWPAFWLLGDDIDKVGWPACGEIDIMESIGEPDKVYGTIHGPGYSGAKGVQGKYSLISGRRLQDDFHIFAVEWEPAEIRFYFDDVMYKSTKPQDIPAGTHWAFDHPFFIILNLAVGGNWPGSPNSETVFPQTMQVDYVRVYQKE